VPIHEVHVWHAHPFGTTGQRFGRRRNAKRFHGIFLSRLAAAGSGSKASATPFMQYRMPVG
jgi:hypothetical protein